MDQSIDVVPHSNITGSPEETALSNTPQKPEFSKVRSEICLDKLSIKELQETFKVTFGRETTVKDKLWLKRRIAKGLINSFVIPATSLIFKDNKLVGDQEKYSDFDDLSKDMTEERSTTICKDVPSSPDYIKGHSNASGHSPFETFGDHYSGNEDFEGEHRAAKRARKPTKRYIEEQLCDESMIYLKDQRISPKSQMESVTGVYSGGRVVVQRSRPRENIMALGEFHFSSWENKAIPAESNLNLSPSQLNSHVRPASGPVQKECATDYQSDKNNSKPVFADVDQETEQDHIDSSGDSSDDNCSGVPNTQSGIRRKHHRAWTLSEVVKLIEGVAKYGVGKWSEIKRFSFSSYSYRTSVDLKLGREAHAYALKRHLEEDAFIACSIIDMYAKNGCIEQSFQVFNGLKKKSAASWNAMILGYGIHGRAKEAIELFEEMQRTGQDPDELTFLGVLTACNHNVFKIVQGE